MNSSNAKSEVNVRFSNLTDGGFVMRVGGEKFDMPYSQFPWFVGASRGQILEVQLRPEYLYWPKLDIHLSLDSLRHPEKYPLKAKVIPISERKYRA